MVAASPPTLRKVSSFELYNSATITSIVLQSRSAIPRYRDSNDNMRRRSASKPASSTGLYNLRSPVGAAPKGDHKQMHSLCSVVCISALSKQPRDLSLSQRIIPNSTLPTKSRSSNRLRVVGVPPIDSRRCAMLVKLGCSNSDLQSSVSIFICVRIL